MSFAASFASVLIAAASVLSPAPADGIRDDARVFAADAKPVLAAEIKAFTDATGIRLYIDTNTYLEGTINPGERARQLVQAWCGDTPGAVICVDRASKPMHAIQISPALWERARDLEVMPALQTAAEQIGRAQVSGEGLADGARTLMKRLVKLEALAKSREKPLHHSDRLLAAVFGGVLLIGGLMAWVLSRWLRRHETQQAVEHLFPDAEVGQRFGAPYGGGVIAETSFRS